MWDTGVGLEGLPECPKCGAAIGDICRTETMKVGIPPCRERLVVVVKHLRAQRDQLQNANTREVLRRIRISRAAQNVLACPHDRGALDALRDALGS